MAPPRGEEAGCQGQEVGVSRIEEVEGGAVCGCASVVSFHRVS